MRLLLMGPPGAGKGTQATAISRLFGVPAISTGDIFRANVAAETPLGLAARRYMDVGEYVPDEVTNAMVADRLAQEDCREGFLLDGYPRTTRQVDELEGILALTGSALDVALLLEADTDELVRRLLLRAEVEGRADDTEAVVRRRLEVYAAETAPLAAAYAERSLLEVVDGLGPVEDVAGRVLAVLARRSAGRLLADHPD